MLVLLPSESATCHPQIWLAHSLSSYRTLMDKGRVGTGPGLGSSNWVSPSHLPLQVRLATASNPLTVDSPAPPFSIPSVWLAKQNFVKSFLQNSKKLWSWHSQGTPGPWPHHRILRNWAWKPLFAFLGSLRTLSKAPFITTCWMVSYCLQGCVMFVFVGGQVGKMIKW